MQTDTTIFVPQAKCGKRRHFQRGEMAQKPLLQRPNPIRPRPTCRNPGVAVAVKLTRTVLFTFQSTKQSVGDDPSVQAGGFGPRIWASAHDCLATDLGEVPGRRSSSIFSIGMDKTQPAIDWPRLQAVGVQLLVRDIPIVICREAAHRCSGSGRAQANRTLRGDVEDKRGDTHGSCPSSKLS